MKRTFQNDMTQYASSTIFFATSGQTILFYFFKGLIEKLAWRGRGDITLSIFRRQ